MTLHWAQTFCVSRAPLFLSTVISSVQAAFPSICTALHHLHIASHSSACILRRGRTLKEAERSWEFTAQTKVAPWSTSVCASVQLKCLIIAAPQFHFGKLSLPPPVLSFSFPGQGVSLWTRLGLEIIFS